MNYPIVDELIIGLVVVLIGVVDGHEDLRESWPLLGVLNVPHSQIYTHLKDPIRKIKNFDAPKLRLAYLKYRDLRIFWQMGGKTCVKKYSTCYSAMTS